METKPSMRYVGGVMIKTRKEEGRKKNVKMEKLKQNKQSGLKTLFSQMLVWSFKAAGNR